MVSFCGLSALSTASALDLRKATKDLYYECHTEMSAGLYKDPKSGEIQATVFEPVTLPPGKRIPYWVLIR